MEQIKGHSQINWKETDIIISLEMFETCMDCLG